MTTSARIVFRGPANVHPVPTGETTISHWGGVKKSRGKVCSSGTENIDRIPRVAFNLAVTLLCCACAPALDWRSMTLAGTPLQVSFPCRPSAMARDLVVVNTPLRWTLTACDASSMTFAVAWADVPDPTRTTAVLQTLARQAGENLRAMPQAAQAASVPGMTPNAASLWVQLQGRSPDGSAVSQQVLLFTHGLRVYQASVLSSGADAGRDAGRDVGRDAAARAFFDALKVQAP